MLAIAEPGGPLNDSFWSNRGRSGNLVSGVLQELQVGFVLAVWTKATLPFSSEQGYSNCEEFIVTCAVMLGQGSCAEPPDRGRCRHTQAS